MSIFNAAVAFRPVSPLPNYINIDTLPTKLSYVDQESIDLTGAVVKAYDGDGNIWEGTGYSGGVIPLSELTVSPTKATYAGGSGQYQTDGAVTVGNVTLEDTLYCIPIVAGAAYVGGSSPTQEQLARLHELRENATFGTCYDSLGESTDGNVWVIGHEDVRSYTTLKNTRVAIAHCGDANIIVISSLDGGVLGLGHENYSSSYSMSASSYTYDNKTVYYHYDLPTVTSSDVEISNINVPTGWAATDKVKAIAWASWYLATFTESQDIYEKNGVKALAIRCTVPVSGTYWRNYRTSHPVGYNEHGAFGAHYWFITLSTEGEIAYLTKYNGGIYVAYSTEPRGTIVIAYEDGSRAQANESLGAYSGDYIFGERNYPADSDEFSYLDIPTSNVDPEGFDFSGATRITRKDQTITVSWNRPVDRQLLTDTFEIEVLLE